MKRNYIGNTLALLMLVVLPMTMLLSSCSSEGSMSVEVTETMGFVYGDTTFFSDDNYHVDRDYVDGYQIEVSTYSEVMGGDISVIGFVKTDGELKEETCKLKKKLKIKLDNINEIKSIEKDLQDLDCS